LTYLAENGLVQATSLPATLYADMAGALIASEAVLQAVLQQKIQSESTYQEVALSDAAAHLALPRAWGLTLPTGMAGGAHAGYRVYACADGRVAVAALEPHFAAALCQLAGIKPFENATMLLPSTHQALAVFFSSRSCVQLTTLATEHDLPLFCMQN
jgi:alpha-methylacyl-CoA racemase